MPAAAGDDDVLLTLPDEQRHRFKAPMGPVYTDASALLADAGEPVIAVGDVVAATLIAAGYPPAVVVVDGRSEREPVEEAVRERAREIERTVEAANPPATITRSLTAAIVEAIDDASPVRIEVDGEEDLAVLPAVLAAPAGATVVYGQPGVGMVAVPVTDETRDAVMSHLEHLAGDRRAFLALVGRNSG